ncbi:MAG: VWA domain-containing protein [Clostridia bacterium]|nr:VWA domain-containing protein [Clostridia bacterium]
MKTEETMNKNRRNDITEVVFILDRSGSMSGLEDDTIGGFNATIERQKQIEGRVYISTVLFDNETVVLHDRVDISEIEPMTRNDYEVRGCTALLDAIGGAIHHIGNIHKYARPEDVPAHTVFIITTDGMENASRTYSSRKVREMIKKQTEKYGWEFIFMAANIDAVETAENIGIRRERAVEYAQDREGLQAEYCAMSDAIETVRCARKLDGGAWRAKVDADIRRRKK